MCTNSLQYRPSWYGAKRKGATAGCAKTHLKISTGEAYGVVAQQVAFMGCTFR